MSRKNILTGLGREAPAAAPADAQAPGAAPVAHLGAMLGAIRDRSERASEIEKALAAGDRVVEVDPSLIDPSPISDRLPASPETEAGLRESIAGHGQRVPVLLRRDPARSGRFITVYGHRRIAVAAALGRKARAIVVDMGDEEAFVAQGVENAERKDLSFIERAVFARKLTEAGVSAKSISAALGTARPNVVTMVTLCRRLPDDVISAIGPSPGLGRRRWEDLAERISALGAAGDKRWRKAIATADFAVMDADRRFAAVLAAVTPKAQAPGKLAAVAYTDPQGATFGLLERTRSGDTRLRLVREADTSFREDGAGFGEWLGKRLQDLHSAWKRGE